MRLWAAAHWAKKSWFEHGRERVDIIVDWMWRPIAFRHFEYHLRDAFGCLDARYNDLPVNFSTGIPLASTPSYRDLMLALEWEVRSLSSYEWLSLLRSPCNASFWRPTTGA